MKAKWSMTKEVKTGIGVRVHLVMGNEKGVRCVYVYDSEAWVYGWLYTQRIYIRIDLLEFGVVSCWTHDFQAPVEIPSECS